MIRFSVISSTVCMQKTILLIVLVQLSSFISVAQASCGNATLDKAYFAFQPTTADAIEQTELRLSNKQANNTDRLYFFSAISHNNTGVTLHRWYFNGQKVSQQQMQSRTTDWRGWSASSLINQAHYKNGKWRVDIFDDHFCRIGRVKLTIHAPDAVINRAKKALQENDITAAKLTLKTALADKRSSRSQRRLWRHFMGTKLVLAEITNDITNQQFVAAQGRLDALKKQQLSELKMQITALESQLDIAKKLVDDNRQQHLKSALYALANSLAHCPTSREQAQRRLNRLLHRDDTYVNKLVRQPNAQVIALTLGLPSGKSFIAQRTCVSFNNLWNRLLNGAK